MSKELNLPGPEMPVIDESRLMAEFGGDEEILRELRDLFLDHAPPLYRAMKEAIANGDCEKVAREAHSFKGACATYGAPRLAMVCREFEMLAKEEDLPTISGKHHPSRDGIPRRVRGHRYHRRRLTTNRPGDWGATRTAFCGPGLFF